MSASKREEARRFFGLARASSGPPLDRPFLIAVGGVIGSGKSSLAAELGRELAVPVVSSDRTRKLSAGLPPTSRGDGTLYAKSERERTYGEIIRRASQVIQSGRGVVLDATFSTRHWRQLAADAARAAQATFVFIETRCRPDLLQRTVGRTTGEAVRLGRDRGPARALSAGVRARDVSGSPALSCGRYGWASRRSPPEMRCASWRPRESFRPRRGAPPEPVFAQIVRAAPLTAHSLRAVRGAEPSTAAAVWSGRCNTCRYDELTEEDSGRHGLFRRKRRGHHASDRAWQAD